MEIHINKKPYSLRLYPILLKKWYKEMEAS